MRTEYGPNRLHQKAQAEWERFKDDRTQRASNHEVARRESCKVANSIDREARFREVLEQVSGPPRAERWTPGACACQAIQGLLSAQGREHHDAKAQAVLILAVVIWDADADQRHAVFTLFGPWGATPVGEIESVSRWAATYFLHNEADLRRWMDTVRMAWMAMPAEPKATHSSDFTYVNWYGTEYTFALGVQSEAVRTLWNEWEKSGLGLHQETIGNAIDAERDNFRMDKAFRNNPAFGTMIQNTGDGKYKLARPAPSKPASIPIATKSAAIPAKAPRKPR